MTRFISSLAIASFASAQLEYLETPVKDIIGFISPTNEQNECKIVPSPEGEIVLCTSANGEITALEPDAVESQGLLWKYPENNDGSISCETGVAFSSASNSIIYGTTEDTGTNCRLHSLSASKDKVEEWNILLEGKCSGTPVISSSGKYVFLTHNNGRSGTFTILEVSEDNQVEVLFQSTDEEEPLSPPGIFHNPEKGNYGNSTVGGLFNDNDIIVWANRPYEGEQGVGAAASYAFQFPIVYDGTTTGLSVTTLQRMNDPWKTVVPPTLTSNGLRMYWAVTKSKILGWTYEDDRDRFNRRSNRNKSFNRGIPAWKPISARVATTQTLAEPVIFTANAGNEFHAMSYTLEELWNVTLSRGVIQQAQVSPDDKVVYFADEIGHAYAYTIDGEKMWDEYVISSDGVDAGYTQSIDGSNLFFASKQGIVYKVKVAVAETASPVMIVTLPPTTSAPISPAPVTPSPTSAPITQAPTLTPTTQIPVTSSPVTPAPVVPPTSAPVVPPTIDLVVPPTEAPVSSSPVTAAPVTAAPMAAVTAAPMAAVTAAPVTVTTASPVEDAVPQDTSSSSRVIPLLKGGTILVSIVICLVL